LVKKLVLDAMKVRAHVFISGRVTGVFFRYHIQELARKLGIRGWVRNLHEEKVEAIFEGKSEDVEKIVKFCHEGPPSARVTHVEVKWGKYTGEFQDFEIRYR